MLVSKVRRDHLRNFARDGESGEALTLQCVSAQCEAADQNREHKLKRIDFRMSQRQLDKSQNHERDAKEHAIVPGEIYGPIECAGAEVHRDRADYANRVKTGQRGEVCGKKQHHDWQTDGNDQRPHGNAVPVEPTKLPRHLAITRHHVKQTDHRYDRGVGRAQKQQAENNSDDPAEHSVRSRAKTSRRQIVPPTKRNMSSLLCPRTAAIVPSIS